MADYTRLGALSRCNNCSVATGNEIVVVDEATHDRWHAEQVAIADPNQSSLFA